MGKVTITRNRHGMESTKFTRMFNVYGIGEELLYKITINGSPKVETNMATYLIKFKEFKKSEPVKISLKNNKDD